MPTRTEIIDMEHQKMRQLQRRFSKYGASDTEPDWHYQYAIKKAIMVGAYFDGLTSSGWELYSGEKGVEKAAAALNNHTADMVKFILDTPISELKSLRDWADLNLWRVNF
jgi:hypothetical protein